MEIWYTARKIFDEDFDKSGWEKYIKWSRLIQLGEVVSLDGLLNKLIFELDYETEMHEIVIDGNQMTDLFKSIDYVKEKSSQLDFYNLLGVIKEPEETRQIHLEKDFDFIGYDLIEKGGTISSLTNCGGFDKTFKPTEQNEFGLIFSYQRAKEIQKELPENNPGQDHVDCFLYEVWRHKFLGRKSK